MIHQVAIKTLPQEWLWCETWCDDASKQYAKTIDLVYIYYYLHLLFTHSQHEYLILLRFYLGQTNNLLFSSIIV